MKRIITFAGFFLYISASAQNEVFRYNPRLLSPGTMPPVEIDESVQGKYLRNQWSKGEVVLKNSNRVIQLPLQFDQYDNKLFFLEDGNMMAFAEPVAQFKMKLVVKNDTVDIAFRSGYPSIHRNNEQTFYEILVDGKFQLLRCKAKTITLYKDADVPEEKRDYKKEMFYALLPNGKLINIKKDQEYLLKTMPEYKEVVTKIIAAHNVRLNSEAALKKLFHYLNL